MDTKFSAALTSFLRTTSLQMNILGRRDLNKPCVFISSYTGPFSLTGSRFLINHKAIYSIIINKNGTGTDKQLAISTIFPEILSNSLSK